ncbi:MAG: stage II sporulation protein M [Ferruginibacter sp.]|nr:stage II sporulation protein M [Ferruginibacter sp.]MBU9936614.1 stage II sporulation protein M [Ferruginibacter sp.]
MREAMFIKKNAEKWNEYQHSPTDNPDVTAERFVDLIDDLSYAKTFYPKSKVTRWINGIAAGIYQSIYRNKKEKYSRIFTFWKYELPLLFKRYHRIFLFTTVVFILFVAIGVFSSMYNENFVRGVLGDGYVDMTEENIAKGDPFGVYKDDNPFSMFVRIGFNNIRVAFLSFIFGFTLGILTMWVMWKNGLLLGSFQYMFFAKGLGTKSVLVIWIHGTLEISAIVIASTAGFILASGILFPKTYSRWVSFKRSARDAAKVLISLVPIFIVAAFFESYITHLMSQTFDKADNPGLPVWVSILILAVSLAFIIWYFVIHPIRLHKKGYYIRPDGIIHRLKKENE